MTSSDRSENSAHATQIIVAMIAVLGVIVSALTANWDKLFPKENTLSATYSGYTPTGKFDVELRYFFLVTGIKGSIEEMQKSLLTALIQEETKRNPENANEVRNAMDKILADSAQLFERTIDTISPIYERYYTVEQMQALNRFYSTKEMQAFVSKSRLMAPEIAQATMSIIRSSMLPENQVTKGNSDASGTKKIK
jgi:hypothetical protein